VLPISFANPSTLNPRSLSDPDRWLSMCPYLMVQISPCESMIHLSGLWGSLHLHFPDAQNSETHDHAGSMAHVSPSSMALMVSWIHVSGFLSSPPRESSGVQFHEHSNLLPPALEENGWPRLCRRSPIKGLGKYSSVNPRFPKPEICLAKINGPQSTRSNGPEGSLVFRISGIWKPTPCPVLSTCDPQNPEMNQRFRSDLDQRSLSLLSFHTLGDSRRYLPRSFS
jgi:hypothetical protein